MEELNIRPLIDQLFAANKNAPSQQIPAWQSDLTQSIDPERQRKENIRSALVSAGQTLASTPGNFLQGIAAAAGGGAKTYNEGRNDAVQKRIAAKQFIDEFQRKEEDRRLDKLKELVGVGRNYNADVRAARPKPEKAPNGYRFKTDGNMEYVTGGPADPAVLSARSKTASQYGDRKTMAEEMGMLPSDPQYRAFVLTGQMPRESAQKLTATDKAAILEADQNAMTMQNVDEALAKAETLNSTAGSGYTANAQAFAARNDPTGFFDDKQGQATTEFNNLVMNQALSQMKAIFGGNPTEGERAVLLQLQASADKTPEERTAILAQARQVAQRRLKFNKDRASELRSQTFYQPDDTQPPQDTSETPDYVQPFIAQGAKQAPDGNWYVPDTNNPGNFLMIQEDAAQ
jgi:hypothetical protein